MATQFITSRPYSDQRFKDRLDQIENFRSDHDGRIDGWSANKTFQPDDLAIFYFALPLMTIEAVAIVDSDPYVEEINSWADFSNPIFADSADGIDNLELINGKQLLKMINADPQIPTRKQFQNDQDSDSTSQSQLKSPSR